MKKYVNGKYIDMTEQEVAAINAGQAENERHYWQSADYGDAINSEIRKKYTESQEFAILRQKDEKPEEYNEYYLFCESCKEYVKKQKQKYGGENI